MMKLWIVKMQDGYMDHLIGDPRWDVIQEDWMGRATIAKFPFTEDGKASAMRYATEYAAKVEATVVGPIEDPDDYANNSGFRLPPTPASNRAHRFQERDRRRR